MKGFMRQRGASWELRVFLGRDPVTGKKRYATKTVRGGKREAQSALAAMITEAERGSMARTVGDVKDDVSSLADAASEAAADEVAALEQSLSALESALTGLAGGITADNVGELTTAVQAVGTSAQAVYGTLSDCA